MKISCPLTIGFSLLLFSPTMAQSESERGTAEEAQALLERAVTHYEEVGREQALDDFNNSEDFIDRDLYVFCFGGEQVLTAHGANAALVGMDINLIKDTNNQPFTLEIWEVGQNNGSGQVEYTWSNPVSGVVEEKSTFVQGVGEDICAVGYYL